MTAIYFAIRAPTLGSIVGVFLASFPILMSIVFYTTFKESKPPLGDIQVKVGDAIMPITAVYGDGETFRLDDLQGQRILLKFFRGAWCPYCSMELKMFEDMKPIFERFDVKIVALSNDAPMAALKHQQRDQLTHLLLSDPELKVIKQYGVEHHKALGGDGASSLTLFGLPFPTKMKYKPMAIPTSILIDEKGIVRWIDQAEDVRLRASEEKLTAALKDAFTD
ncbi:peroxiredoxin family protein [Motilimonas pumila]|nr:peroxiredoxin family protein [Motilimonas pumila]